MRAACRWSFSCSAGPADEFSVAELDPETSPASSDGDIELIELVELSVPDDVPDDVLVVTPFFVENFDFLTSSFLNAMIVAMLRSRKSGPKRIRWLMPGTHCV